MDRCYESPIVEFQNTTWIQFYLSNFKDLSNIRVLVPDSLIVLNQDTLIYSKCDDYKTPTFYILSSGDYLIFEMYLNGSNYMSGEITNNLLCDSATKDRTEIGLLVEYYSLLAQEYI